MFDARLRPLVDRILDPVGAFVARRGVTANQVSFAGFGLGIAAVIAVGLVFEIAAVVVIIANRVCDGLDGAVARLVEGLRAGLTGAIAELEAWLD